MADLDRIKRNVAKMAQMNAPESDIDGYIASESVTLEQVRNHKFSQNTETQPTPKPQPVAKKQPTYTGAYADIMNDSSLTREQKAEAIRKRGEEINKNIDKDLRKDLTKMWAGGALEIGSAAIPIGAGLKLGSLALKAGKPIAKQVIGNLAKRGAIEGALSGLVGGIGRGMAEDRDLGGIAQTALTDTAIGTVGGGALGTLGGKITTNVGKTGKRIKNIEAKQLAKKQPKVTKEVKAELVEQPIQQVDEVVESVPKDKYIGQKFFFGDKEDEIVEYLPQFDMYRGKNPEGLDWGATLYKKEDLDKYHLPEGYDFQKVKAEKDLINQQKLEKQIAKENLEKQRIEEYNNLDDFGSELSDMQLGKIRKTLNKQEVYNGELKTNKQAIKDLLGENATPDIREYNGKKEYIMRYPNGNYITINKTKYDYAKHLQNKPQQLDDIIPEQVVEATQPTQKQSKFIQTVKNSDLATDELKGKVNANYQTITNQETLQNAQNIIDNDFEGSIRKVLTNDKPEALDIAMAEDLARRLQQTGNPKDLETAVDIIERTATSLSKAGQTIQAASMWGRLTPEGSLLAYQREINRNIPKEVKEIIDNANSIIKKANTATTSKEAENIIRTGLKGLALTPKEKIVKQLKAGYDKNGKIDVDELVNAVKEKYNIKTITPDDIQEFNQLSKNVENATDKRQRDIAVALLKRKIEEVTPSSTGRKISTLQTAGQLLNPKTFIRNLGGNTLYGGIEDLTQTFIATPLDKLTSLRTGQRTIVPTNLATQFRGAKQGLVEGVEDILKGADTSPSNTKYDLFSGRTFRNKNTDRTNLSDIWEADSSNKAKVTKQYFNELLTKSRLGQAITERDLAPLKKMPGELANSIETLLNLSLRVPDRAAYQAVYNEAVENMLRAEKITNRGVVKELKQKLAKTKSENRKASIIKKIENLENPTPTDDILAQAHLEALQRTFQDTNQISSAAQGFKRWLNANKDFGLGDLTIKYPKTPANILSRGIDYSPIGLGRGLWNSRGLIAGNAPYNQRVANMEIARGLMGSGLYGAGLYSAANLGVRGKREDKQKLQQNLMAQGNRPYSIPVGNKSYSYDWAVPISMSYGGGANLNYGDDVIESILSASDPLTEQPLLQGARRILGGNYQDIPQALVGEVIGLPSSFYPAVARQTAQSIDPYYRETKSDKKGLLGTAETAMNRLKSNIPFVSETLPIKYDVTGQPIRRAETVAGRIGQAFFNPANVSIRPDNETLDKSVNLYDYTGDSGALYPIANNKITISGKEKRLTNQERSDYQHDLGRITQSIRTNLFNDEEFNQLTEDEQVKQLEKYHNAINNAVKYRLFGVEPKSYKKLTNEILEYYDEY